MMIAYTGLDGSGKTYHMAEVCQRMIAAGIDCFGSTPFAGARLLDSHRQLIRIERAHVFFDEWHQDHDAKGWYNLDPVLRHIITQHRKYKLVIHWSAQHFKFMDSYIRRETTFIWEHEALFRDADSGQSRVKFNIPFFGKVEGMHRAWKYAALEAELGHRRPKILEKKTFFINPAVYNSYDSYKKILLTSQHVSDDEMQAIKDPYTAEKIVSCELAPKIEHKRNATILLAANPAEDRDADFVPEKNRFDGDEQPDDDIKLPERKKYADYLCTGLEIPNPFENLRRKRGGSRQKTRNDGDEL